jgi:hypothetical protein
MDRAWIGGVPRKVLRTLSRLAKGQAVWHEARDTSRPWRTDLMLGCARTKDLLFAFLPIATLAVVSPGCSSAQSDSPAASSDDSVTAQKKKKDAGSVCVARCTSDDDCAATCPPVPGAVTSCCDLATATCYASRVSCPVVVDGGEPPPTY